MFAAYRPDQENTLGARWNAPEVPAIYTSLDRDVVIAESEHQIRAQPNRPWAKRSIYRIAVALENVVDLTDWSVLRRLKLSPDMLQDVDLSRCQQIGSAAEHLGHDGLLVPSARVEGTNLVIYPNRTTAASYRFDVKHVEVLESGREW